MLSSLYRKKIKDGLFFKEINFYLHKKNINNE